MTMTESCLSCAHAELIPEEKISTDKTNTNRLRMLHIIRLVQIQNLALDDKVVKGLGATNCREISNPPWALLTVFKGDVLIS